MGELDRLSAAAREVLQIARPAVSPMVRLELAFLHELGRITVGAPAVLDALRIDADLFVAESRFEQFAARAATLSFTRDPFDRMIAAHALADDVPLLTKDRTLRSNCPVAFWDPLPGRG